MTTWDAGKLMIRLREVIESSAGTLRTTDTLEFVGGLAPGLDGNEESRRAMRAEASDGFEEVLVESRVLSVKRSAASPPVIGNLALYDIEVEVRAVYPINTKALLTDATRDKVAGYAARHADTLSQALGYPGNLTQTTAGVSTGLVSGLLAYVGSEYAWAGDAGKAGTLTGRHRFKGIAKSAPAVS